jgi:predicted unusual protein kinase regulating ubiquinone biosynthesis (AarF/ABC1/UbiB family)
MQGNVLVLPDGRLGLLDYGMVGRLSENERRTVAEVVVALKRNERRKIADLYLHHGFRATFRSEPIRDANVLHRFATFHLDKVDLSSIVMETGELLDLGTLFRNTVVHSVPDWIAQARRLSGLLMGVTAQALRPVSLAHEWHDIAAHVLRQQQQQQHSPRRRRRHGDEDDQPATTRIEESGAAASAQAAKAS